MIIVVAVVVVAVVVVQYNLPMLRPPVLRDPFFSIALICVRSTVFRCINVLGAEA